MIKTTLKWHEVMLGGMTGVMRHVKSLKKGLKDAHGYDGEDGWTKHIDGALGEVVVAKALDHYWGGPIDTFKSADLGDIIQVRTRSRADYELIVRPDDLDQA